VTAFPCSAVAPHWSPANPVGVIVELALSGDGESWSSPVAVSSAHADGGPPDRDGRTFGALTFARGAQFVRFRTLDEGGAPFAVDGLAFAYLDASHGPSTADLLAASALGIGGVRPPIVSREAWGADESLRYGVDGELIWPPEHQAVEHVIIHHTDTENFADPVEAVRAIYHYHAVVRGWGDIGYNYLVDHVGNVYEGRAGGESVIGGHAYGYGPGSSGIAVIGSFNFDAATIEAQAGLTAITAWVTRGLDPYGARPFHDLAALPTICGHVDLASTACPGGVLYDELPLVRDLVAEAQRAASALADAAPAPGQTVRVLTPDGNLRGGPGLDEPILRTLAAGTLLTVISGPVSVDDFFWYEVSDPEGAGWCASTIFAVDSGVMETTGASFAPGDVVSVATDGLNLRMGPSATASVVATLPFGVRGVILAGPQPSSGFNWYEVETDTATGWGAGMYLAHDGGEPIASTGLWVGDVVFVDTDAVALRAEPDGVLLAEIPGGTWLTITAGPVSSGGYDWYAVNSRSFADGWCAGIFLSRVPFEPGQLVRVVDGALALRAEADPDAEVLAVLADGAGVRILSGPTASRGIDWYQVESAFSGIGWCAGRFLTAL
jgi:uncharacterized protein YraI